MAVTVTQLTEAVLKGSTVKHIVQEQLEVIDKLIQRKQSTIGENILVYDLPLVFHGINTDATMIKKVVYVSVIQSLSERGFDVKIKMEDTQSKLLIKWTVAIDKQLMNQYDTYLEQHKIKP